MNVGPAYNLPYILTNQGCPDCDPKHTKATKIDKTEFSAAVPQSRDFFIVTEPESGYLIENHKKATVFVALAPTDTLAFPDLELLAKDEQIIPVFSYQEEFKIGENEFKSEFGFVPETRHDIVACHATFWVLFTVFTVLAIAVFIFYWFKIRPQEKRESMLKSHESTVSLESNHENVDY